uniref:Uncharacterized protein n=1 Tax=Pipistrellus kuhlii TaxID=59472 RepID=A0A7J7XUM1_PIPKU|nr:hypothetical protein mPipKuh1_010439 [Pipistrellus kuhlii]
MRGVMCDTGRFCPLQTSFALEHLIGPAVTFMSVFHSHGSPAQFCFLPFSFKGAIPYTHFAPLPHVRVCFLECATGNVRQYPLSSQATCLIGFSGESPLIVCSKFCHFFDSGADSLTSVSSGYILLYTMSFISLRSGSATYAGIQYSKCQEILSHRIHIYSFREEPWLAQLELHSHS